MDASGALRFRRLVGNTPLLAIDYRCNGRRRVYAKCPDLHARLDEPRAP